MGNYLYALVKQFEEKWAYNEKTRWPEFHQNLSEGLLEPRHFLFAWLDHELLHLSMKNRASLPPPSCSKAGLKYQKEKTLRTFSLKHDSQPYDSQTNTSLNNLFIFTNKYLIVIANSLAIHINLQFSDLWFA